MILPRYHIAASGIAGAGKGLFLDEPMAAARIICAPDGIEQTWSLAQILASPELSVQEPATARWFEDRYTVSPDWPDECSVNHSFAPTGLWHLGFIFAARDLDTGSEITVDYRHLLAPGQAEGFIDAASGERIVGLSWESSLAASTQALAALLTK